MSVGIYVHIPFCKSKCFYCDFISYANKIEYVPKYVQALIKEIKYNKTQEEISSIYIGGGTPSFIDSKYIEEILICIKEKYNIKNDCEITIEINPESANKEKLKKYYEIGINRLSIGMQATNNNVLNKIGRIHNVEMFLEAYNNAKLSGFNNINVDLMFGLENQTLKDIENALEIILKLQATHISTYSLIVEENTKLEQMVKDKKYNLVDEKLEREMYYKIKKVLEENKYIHYEISNFAKEGLEAKHNLVYWEQKEYLGFGLAAHSYIKNARYSNTDNMEKYIENIEKGDFLQNRIINEIQDKKTKMNEYIILGLRKIKGVNKQDFLNKFNINIEEEYKNILNKLVLEKLICINKENIYLTQKGLDLANIVWQEFV